MMSTQELTRMCFFLQGREPRHPGPLRHPPGSTLGQVRKTEHDVCTVAFACMLTPGSIAGDQSPCGPSCDPKIKSGSRLGCPEMVGQVCGLPPSRSIVLLTVDQSASGFCLRARHFSVTSWSGIRMAENHPKLCQRPQSQTEGRQMCGALHLCFCLLRARGSTDPKTFSDATYWRQAGQWKKQKPRGFV